MQTLRTRLVSLADRALEEATIATRPSEVEACLDRVNRCVNILGRLSVLDRDQGLREDRLAELIERMAVMSEPDETAFRRQFGLRRPRDIFHLTDEHLARAVEEARMFVGSVTVACEEPQA